MKQLILDNIIINDNHTYFHEDIGTVASVTSIITGSNGAVINNDAMNNGTLIHEAIASYYMGNTSLYEELNSELKSKAEKLMEAVYKIGLKPKYCEKSFIYVEKGIKYAGTVDLECEDTIVEFKTGQHRAYYAMQLAAYCNALDKEHGILIYFENEELKTCELKRQEVHAEYVNFIKKFQQRLDEKKSISSDLQKELRRLREYSIDKDNITRQYEEQKALVENRLKKDNLTKIDYDGVRATLVNKRGSFKLMPKAKLQIFEQHPEYFEKVEGKEYWQFEIEKKGEIK